MGHSTTMKAKTFAALKALSNLNSAQKSILKAKHQPQTTAPRKQTRLCSEEYAYLLANYSAELATLEQEIWFRRIQKSSIQYKKLKHPSAKREATYLLNRALLHSSAPKAPNFFSSYKSVKKGTKFDKERQAMFEKLRRKRKMGNRAKRRVLVPNKATGKERGKVGRQVVDSRKGRIWEVRKEVFREGRDHLDKIKWERERVDFVRRYRVKEVQKMLEERLKGDDGADINDDGEEWQDCVESNEYAPGT